jgi:hypothetical protein
VEFEDVGPELLDHPDCPLVVVALFRLLHQAQYLVDFLHLRRGKDAAAALLPLPPLQPIQPLLARRQPLGQSADLKGQLIHYRFSPSRFPLALGQSLHHADRDARVGIIRREGVPAAGPVQFRFMLDLLSDLVAAKAAAAPVKQMPLSSQTDLMVRRNPLVLAFHVLLHQGGLEVVAVGLGV